MIEYLSVNDVVTINADEVGEGAQLLDLAGLEAAVARPYSGFGDVEAFETLYDKAGALLHGLCSTQYFQDGNKRTAWLAAKTFLAINDVELEDVADIQSEAFVLAVATIHDFGPDRAAEWFRATEADPQSTLFAVDRDRLAIDGIGVVEVKEAGGWVDGWSMHWQETTPSDTALHLMIDEFGRLGGWSYQELHAIAHGVPCHCPAFAIRSAGDVLD